MSVAERRSPAHLPGMHGIQEDWVRLWYAVLRSLPVASRVRSKLVVSAIPEDDPDSVLFGMHDPNTDTITVGLDPNHYEMLTTLIHEVAHAAAYERHRRAHGHRWRRAYRQLVKELTGADPGRKAEEIRRVMRRSIPSVSRASCLDLAVGKIIYNVAPRILARNARCVIAEVNGRVIRAERSPPGTRG